MENTKGMNNPIVAAAAIDKGGDILKDNFVPIIATAGAMALLFWGPSVYKSWRAKQYARNNAGSPKVIAAGIIANSLIRFEFPGALGWILPDISISTNEAALFQLATQIESYKEVSDAYYILFDGALDQDIQQGLDTQEMQTFYQILKAKGTNQSNETYAVGSTLYCAAKAGIQVFKAAKVGNGWNGTSELYGNFQFNEEVGKVIAHGIVPQGDRNGNDGQKYYIVENCFVFGIGCSTGVVLQSQIINRKL